MSPIPRGIITEPFLKLCAPYQAAEPRAPPHALHPVLLGLKIVQVLFDLSLSLDSALLRRQLSVGPCQLSVRLPVPRLACIAPRLLLRWHRTLGIAGRALSHGWQLFVTLVVVSARKAGGELAGPDILGPCMLLCSPLLKLSEACADVLVARLEFESFGEVLLSTVQISGPHSRQAPPVQRLGFVLVGKAFLLLFEEVQHLRAVPHSFPEAVFE
mmetsp:Transcript_29163/g.69544  ORF Transcript_29163/g.69544 Transcript_29163/m.69544 type:complete len:214 (+) Transcript_29163:37-678(+)